jgi:hypothetical protein
MEWLERNPQWGVLKRPSQPFFGVIEQFPYVIPK